MGAGAPHRVEPGAVGQAEVEEDDVDAALVDAREALVEPRGGLEAQGAAFAVGQHALDEQDVSPVVLDEESGDVAVVHADHSGGSLTMVSQKSPTLRTTCMNWARSTGLVM